MKEICRKIISILFVFAFLLNSFPAIVLAQMFNDPFKDNLPNNKIDTYQKSMLRTDGNDNFQIVEENNKPNATQPEIIYEVIEKRALNEKHFSMSDGSFAVAVYPNDVHYEKDGKLIDIDNTLVETNKAYQIKSNNIDVTFEKQASSEKTIQVKNKGFSLSLSLMSSNKSDSRINNNLTTKSEIKKTDDVKTANAKKMEVDKNNSQIVYENVLPSTDLKYDIIANYIKESLILKDEKALKNKFIYNIDITGLTIVQETNNLIKFINPETKEQVFYLEAPYIYDSKWEYSDNIKLSIEDNQLLIELDEEWLNSKDRVYPIVVDPIIGTNDRRDAIQDCYIYEEDTNNAGKCAAHVLRVGNSKWAEVNGKPVRSIVKFELPVIGSSDQVVAADLLLNSYNYALENPVWLHPDTQIQINVHKLLTSWTESNANWIRLGATANWETRVTDYFKFNYSTSTPIKTYNADVTSIVKDWYVNGNNNGIMLKSLEGTTTMRADAFFFSSDVSSTYAIRRPYILIQYRNQTGLEGYITYHTQNNGRITGYTNDYNGNVVLTHELASTPGSKLPVVLKQTWNSNDKDVDYYHGRGFRLNYHQILEGQIIDSIQYLKYTDGDGTRHYFTLQTVNGNQFWGDEDGLGLKVTSVNGEWVMEDKDGNKSTFTYNQTYNLYRLTKIKDPNNNVITITWGAEAISNIQDAAGDYIYLTYTSNRLTTVTDKNNRTTTLTYNSDNLLTKVTYPDDKYISYTYNTSVSRLIEDAYDIDNSRIKYDYYPTSPYRVKKITEYSKTGDIGNYLNVTYKENTTTFTDNKERTNTYTFNNWGQTINISNVDSSGSLGKAYGKSYNYATGTNNNKLTSESILTKPVTNYVLNSSLETTDTWILANYGTNPGTCSYDTTNVYIGTKSIKCVNTYTESNGSYFYQLTSAPKGKTYTLSAYVKTSNLGQGTGGVELNLSYNNKSGVFVEKTTHVKVNQDWTKVSVTIDYPSDATSPLRVTNYLFNNSGTVYLDNIQLEEGSITNNYNMLDNSSFDYGLTNWVNTQQSDPNVDKVEQEGTNNVLRLVGVADKLKVYRQRVLVNGQAEDTYFANTWIKNKGVPNIDVNTKAAWFQVVIRNNDGTSPGYITYIDPSDAWQYISQYVTTSKSYYAVDIYIGLYYNANELYADNVGLFKDLGNNSYSYNSDGNLTSATTLNKEKTTFNYDSKNQLTSIENPKGANFTYTYDANIKNRLLKGTSSLGLANNLAYDTYGNNTSFKLTHANTTHYIETTLQYSNSGNYLSKIIDPLGNNTNYAYNTNTGNVNSITDAKSIATSYTYDIMDKTSTVTRSSKTNTYTYTNDLLTNISHNGFNYSFIYDNYNQLYSAKVGSQVLITNTYAANNGNLTRATYGNSQYIDYQYDSFDRLSKKIKQDTSYTYEYDSFSNMARMKDGNNVVTDYTYDFADRIIELQSGEYGIKYNYDKISNPTSITYQLGTNSRQQSNTYDTDNKITKVTHDSTNINYTYDWLSRLAQKQISVSSTTYNTYYLYTANGNNTSTQPLSVNNNGQTLSYEYDSLYNITKIYKNNVIQNEYEYDSLNQLTSEKNHTRNEKIDYTYDIGGNITSKVIKNLATGATISTISYSYANTNWKDQLTSFNSKTITYDNIGNPLSYGSNISFTWQNGRELATYNDSSKNLNISYKYNDSDIRTEKTVNGTTTKFYLEGSNIIFEDRGNNNVLYYFYDASGLAGFEYNNNTYYYIKNVQNDVIGILDSSFNVVANYEYSSWGEIISITDGNGNNLSGNASHIANINPFRYRSYYFDSETGLYYLNSRYYSPEFGRYLNADGIMGANEDIFGYNLYAYVSNNPVNFSDPTGHWKIPSIKDIWNGIKKVASSIAKAFVVEVGNGTGTSNLGAGGKALGTGYGASTSNNIITSTKNGTVTNSTNKTSSVQYGPIGLEYETSKITSINGKSVLDSKSTSSLIIKFGPLEFSKDKIFFNVLEFEVYPGPAAGGYVKVGWDVIDFNKYSSQSMPGSGKPPKLN